MRDAVGKAGRGGPGFALSAFKLSPKPSPLESNGTGPRAASFFTELVANGVFSSKKSPANEARPRRIGWYLMVPPHRICIICRDYFQPEQENLPLDRLQQARSFDTLAKCEAIIACIGFKRKFYEVL
jgi:hypothetical protein